MINVDNLFLDNFIFAILKSEIKKEVETQA